MCLSLDPVYYNTATAVWRSTDLFAISLAKYTTANEALIDFTRSADTVAQINSISDLTPNSAVVQTMSNFIFKSAPQQPVPLKAVQSDIVIMIDVTSAMIPAAFNNTLSWLNNFVQYFTISKQFTQISLVLYDTSVRTGSFNLVGDSATLSQKLTGLQWPNSTEPKLNLLGAVQYITNTVLTPDQGWRQQSTYVLVVAINTQIVNTCDDIKSKGTFNLAQKADVYGMALTGDLAVESYLYCIIPPFPRMNFAKAVPYSFLIQSGLTDTVYDNEVSRSYQLWTNRQPFNTPIPMNLLQIDIIFLVDQSMHLSQSAFMRLQDLIANFAVIGALNVSSSATQLSVISYDKDFFDGGSFALTSATNLNDLTARINGLQWNSGSSAVSFNISGAIDYLTTQVLPQRQAGRAAGVVIFSSSPYATAPSDVQIQKLNSMSGVYGVDVTGLGAAPNYLLQVTKFNNLNIRRLSNAGVLNPNGDIETMQRLNSFISNVANSPNFRNKNLGR
uniref:VWFA domain-containing protein n=1 Tax=Plectus sambesii TaxID=2011161 RepID=A0A914WMW8_9BILA